MLLINPPVRKVIEKRYDAPDFPHIGLAYVASYLASKDIECHVIDAKFEKLIFDDIIAKIKTINPDIIGLTAFTLEIENAALFAQAVKKQFQAFVVIGGIHATVLPGETLREFESFDALVFGEGEITLHELVEAYEAGSSFESIRGVAYRHNNKIIVNDNRPHIEDIDALPVPDWSLFPKAEEYPLMSSRGCPFKCIFCANPNGRKPRLKSAQNFAAEVFQVVEKFAPKKLVFFDEIFTLDKVRTHQILDLFISYDLAGKVEWYTSSHMNCLNYELMLKMKEAGCISLGIGFESGNEDILRSLKKGVSKKRGLRVVKWAKKAGLPIDAYFILGHPDETKKTAWETIKFAGKLNTEFTTLGIMVPFPGTRVAEWAAEGKHGYRLIANKWSDYNKQLGNAIEFEHLSRFDLEKLQLIGYLYVLIKNMRIRDLRRFIFKYYHEGFQFAKKLFLSYMKKVMT